MTTTEATSPEATSPAPLAAPVDAPSPARGARCFGDGDPLYEEYHDTEWGIPVHGDEALFERLALEAFQSGLAWITVLRKRPAFRAAFAGFDPEVVARFTEEDVERLLQDASIIRNRMKIEATISNARALLALHEQGRTLDDLVWSFAPGGSRAPEGGTPPDRPRPATFADLAASTPESVALAKALKKEGFKFIGPTTAYAAMQACGLVDDHLATCPVVTSR
ncbi:DNA-3-methyladenine glycosylase I [Oerskovia merdavium]|uniref:DNA-3-methyladenine glycosylase I n=1 Tax=Oerskovia merdavium TaxID=2762227 RepID=A0ABR8U5Q1_9CELL|nr:DNA-3-methyladenine glycosylase I [Oerskovia merdavium]MBD7982859.1 DNA-3-methyladenine glycosylase I [Oerskovia merdavium]